MSDKVAILQVSNILDKYTLVATGDSDKFYNGQSVFVLGEGGHLADGTPIVVPKAKLRVKANAGAYVILEYESPTEEKEVDIPRYPSLDLFTARTERVKVKTREPLNVREGQVSGNPGNRPIEVGDHVISADEFKEYVEQKTPKT
jgi:hypothetical protein